MAGPSYKWPLIIFLLLGALAAIWTGNRWAKLQGEASAPVEPQSPTGDIFVAGSQPRTVLAVPASTDASTQLERCLVKLTQAKDPNPPLSVRATPSPAAAIVAEIANEQFLDVVGQQNGWFAVTVPNQATAQGWVPMALTDYGCHTKLARVVLPPDQTKTALVRGRFVGPGVHQYKLALERGQTLTISGRGGPMPALQSPSEAVVFAGPGRQDSTLETDVWSGKLNESGDYQLVLRSDTFGYDYAFNVDVK
ncbi:MAG: hypothetical protein HC824_01990 [Synechococcales cyanobacterium RM1_1_8]|nr:hypothetical protein [Synechococcales cyanobacterium RM1_1_8]